MVGYVTNAVAEALKKWQPLREANIIPVMATSGDSVVVNTPIPAVVVNVTGEDGEGNTYLGGGIRQYFELSLHCLLPITNYTFSVDNNKQSELLDLSDEVIRCIERTTELNRVKVVHDLNLQFDRMETDTTYATQGSMSVTVDVHRVVYKGSVRFDLYKDSEHHVGDVTLEKVTIEEENV